MENPKPTHYLLESREIKFVNHRGKACVRYEEVYARTPATVAQIEDERLGEFAQVALPKKQERWPPWITANQVYLTRFDPNQQKILIAMRLRTDPTPHKVLFGTEILREYLKPEAEDRGSGGFRDYYREFPQLFLKVGGETPNKHFPILMTQILEQREFHNLMTWVISRFSAADLVVEWGMDLTDHVLTRFREEKF